MARVEAGEDIVLSKHFRFLNTSHGESDPLCN